MRRLVLPVSLAALLLGSSSAFAAKTRQPQQDVAESSAMLHGCNASGFGQPSTFAAIALLAAPLLLRRRRR